jgi:hypothetical protein
LDRDLPTVELTNVAPLLFGWLMLIVQYGLCWRAKQVANAAAAEAVDVAQTPEGIAAYSDALPRELLAESGNLRNVAVTVDRGTDVVTVQVQGDAPQLVRSTPRRPHKHQRHC